MINRHDISHYTVNELIEFLLESETEVCFSQYARQYINNMENSGHKRNAKNYHWQFLILNVSLALIISCSHI